MSLFPSCRRSEDSPGWLTTGRSSQDAGSQGTPKEFIAICDARTTCLRLSTVGTFRTSPVMRQCALVYVSRGAWCFAYVCPSDANGSAVVPASAGSLAAGFALGRNACHPACMNEQAPKLTLVSSAAGWLVEIVAEAAGNLATRPRYYVAIEDPDAAERAVRRFAKLIPTDAVQTLRTLSKASVQVLGLRPGEVRLA